MKVFKSVVHQSPDGLQSARDRLAVANDAAEAWVESDLHVARSADLALVLSLRADEDCHFVR